MQPSRAEALALLFEFTQDDALRKHGRAVEQAAAVGRPLEEHVGFLIEALKPIAEEIGL
jgi:predicted hydrolase (HD superfamily)